MSLSVSTALSQQVAARTPVDERELRSVTDTITFLATATTPFSEVADDHHVTASAFVVSSRGVILHRHKKLGIWVQPGGHIDDGEMPWEAACREATEETGLPVTLWRPDVCHVDVHPGPRGHTHYDVRYLVVAPPLDPSPPADESQDVWWFSWDDALARAEEALRPALAELSRLLADVVLD